MFEKKKSCLNILLFLQLTKIFAILTTHSRISALKLILRSIHTEKKRGENNVVFLQDNELYAHLIQLFQRKKWLKKKQLFSSLFVADNDKKIVHKTPVKPGNLHLIFLLFFEHR